MSVLVQPRWSWLLALGVVAIAGVLLAAAMKNRSDAHHLFQVAVITTPRVAADRGNRPFPKLPYEVRLPADDGHEPCVMCHLPRFCISPRSTIVFPKDTESDVKALAETGSCKLRNYDENGTVTRFYTSYPTSVEFADISDNDVFPLDMLNIDMINPFTASPFKTAGYDHFPHYVETTFLKSWRSLSFISDACEQAGRSDNLSVACDLLSPAIFVCDSIRTRTVNWFRGMHAVFQRVYPRLALVDESATFQNENRTRSLCYRSAFVQKCKDYGPPFLNEFRRRSLGLKELQSAVQAVTKSKKRRVNIGFLTRDGERGISDIDAIKEYVVEVYRPDGDVSFEVFSFEDKSFMYQLVAIRQCDILVAGHGAGLANILFMKDRAHVIEMTVYGLPTATFAHFAKIAGLKHETVMSRPDARVVRDCARARFMSEFVADWDKVCAAPFEEVAQKDLSGYGVCPYCVRVCLRKQKLYVEPEVIGERVVSAIRSQVLLPPRL